MAKEHTIKDYHKMVDDTKSKYEMDKMNFRMNYTSNSQNTNGYEEILFTNQLKATKILFNHEMKLLIKSEIYVDDAKRMLSMLEELNHE